MVSMIDEGALEAAVRRLIARRDEVLRSLAR